MMLIFLDAWLRVGAAIWTKVKRPITRIQLQQALHRAEALDDALGVVEAVDADAELVFGRQAFSWRMPLRQSATVLCSISGSGGHAIEIG